MAKVAAESGQLYQWALDYLASEQEEQLLKYLQSSPRQFFGPELITVNLLERTIGSEVGMLNVESVADREQKIKHRLDQINSGVESPIIAEYSQGTYLICDGNHLFEALLQLGRKQVWVIYWKGDEIRREAERSKIT